MNKNKESNISALIGIIIVVAILLSIAVYNLFFAPNKTTARIIENGGKVLQAKPLVELESAASAAWEKIESKFDKDEDLTSEYLKLKE